jgi:hypothetical protein
MLFFGFGLWLLDGYLKKTWTIFFNFGYFLLHDKIPLRKNIFVNAPKARCVDNKNVSVLILETALFC